MEERILVVDDNPELRELAQSILITKGYQVTLAEDGKQAFGIFEKTMPDLIVSDIAMPEMDGFALLEAVRSRNEGVTIPFLFLSAYSRRTDLSRARRLGVDDYLIKPFDAHDLLDAIRTRLDRRQAMQVFDTREAHLQTVIMMANVIEARDIYTRRHAERTRDIAVLLGKALGWDADSLAVLEFGAILHDIGKIVVPANILNKSGDFTLEEWEIMSQHPEAGACMLDGVTHLKAAKPFVLYHHEKWDGTGYPFGLAGENIPLEGRIMAVADVYDALTSERPYHKNMSKEDALNRIQRAAERILTLVL